MRLTQRIKLIDLEITKTETELARLQAKLSGLQAARAILVEPELKPKFVPKPGKPGISIS